MGCCSYIPIGLLVECGFFCLTISEIFLLCRANFAIVTFLREIAVWYDSAKVFQEDDYLIR